MPLFTEHLYNYPVHPEIDLLEEEVRSALRLTYEQIASLIRNQPLVVISSAFILTFLFMAIYMIVYCFSLVVFEKVSPSQRVTSRRERAIDSGDYYGI